MKINVNILFPVLIIISYYIARSYLVLVSGTALEFRFFINPDSRNNPVFLFLSQIGSVVLRSMANKYTPHTNIQTFGCVILGVNT